jgi:hypothetical protein
MTINRRRGFVIAGGALLSAALVLSPVTVVGVAVLGVIVGATIRGLRGTERTIILILLLAGIGLRLATLVGLFLSSSPGHLISFPFDGDGQYLKQRSIWVRNVWVGTPVAPSAFSFAFEAYARTSYINVIAFVQYLLGAAPYAIHLFNVCCFVATAAVLHRLARAAYGGAAAAIALTLILFWPTQVLWSVSALKDPLYLALLTCAVGGFIAMARRPSAGRFLFGLALMVAATMALNTVRVGAGVLVAAALIVASVGAFVTRRRAVLAPAAFVAVAAAVVLAAAPPARIQNRLLPYVQSAARQHFGNAETFGHAYKLLDQRFYSGERLDTMTWPEAQRFAVRSAWSFLAMPFPWQSASASELLIVPQQLAWYALLLLAVPGIVRGCRDDALVTWTWIGVMAASAAVIAPNEGNVGTMVRHRDSVVPFLACLSAVGVTSLLAAALNRSQRPARAMTMAEVDASARAAVREMARTSRLTALFAGGVRALRSAAAQPGLDHQLQLAVPETAPERIRAAGQMLLAGAASAAVFAVARRAPWPSVAVWLTLAVSACGLIVGARQFAAALRGHRLWQS